MKKCYDVRPCFVIPNACDMADFRPRVTCDGCRGDGHREVPDGSRDEDYAAKWLVVLKLLAKYRGVPMKERFAIRE